MINHGQYDIVLAPKFTWDVGSWIGEWGLSILIQRNVIDWTLEIKFLCFYSRIAYWPHGRSIPVDSIIDSAKPAKPYKHSLWRERFTSFGNSRLGFRLGMWPSRWGFSIKASGAFGRTFDIHFLCFYFNIFSPGLIDLDAMEKAYQESEIYA